MAFLGIVPSCKINWVDFNLTHLTMNLHSFKYAAQIKWPTYWNVDGLLIPKYYFLTNNTAYKPTRLPYFKIVKGKFALYFLFRTLMFSNIVLWMVSYQIEPNEFWNLLKQVLKFLYWLRKLIWKFCRFW